MGGLLNRLFGRSDYIGETVFIHGQPYVIERRLGAGAFGAVFSASAPDGSPVAVKVNNLRGLPPLKSQKIVQTYLNEVALLERLRRESNHVVYIYDFDFEPSNGQAYIVMELGGDNLRAYIDRLRAGGHTIGPALDPFAVKDFWKQMVSIIYTLHRNSIIHMDFKPDNLILFGPLLKIADLGTSKRANALGQAGLGTMFFSAPEIMQDRSGLQRFYSPKADIWSLGAILYFMLYGRPPFYSPYAANPPPGFFPPADPYLNDVLRRTLVMNPLYRADITTLLQHPFTRF